jgi:hypothetical protein
MKNKKTGGRRAGTPNRTTAELREALQSFIDANIDQLQDDFDTLEPEKRLTFFEKIVKMVLPPPVNPEQLTEPQLIQVLEYLKKQRDDQNKS